MSDIRDELDALGRRRDKLDSDEESLRQDTREVLRKAIGEKVPVAEAARRVKLNRSTVYELYLGDEHAGDGAAHGGASARERGKAVAG